MAEKLRELTLAECEEVSGGWGPGFGVLTAARETSAPSVSEIVVTKPSGVTVGAGQYTAATAKLL
jgi:hypothetical protein